MTVVVSPLTPGFGAEIAGIDLRRPLDEGHFEIVEDALNRFSVLVFVEQELSDEQQVNFSKLFGPLETSVTNIRRDTTPRLSRPELAEVSNLDENNEILGADDRRRMYNLGNQLWHTDSSFKRVPARA